MEISKDNAFAFDLSVRSPHNSSVLQRGSRLGALRAGAQSTKKGTVKPFTGNASRGLNSILLPGESEAFALQKQILPCEKFIIIK